MDGTLIDSEHIWERVVIRTYRGLGVNLTSAHRKTMIGRTPRENAERLFAEQPWTGPSPVAVGNDIVSNVVEEIQRTSALTLMPGVDHALQVCKKAKLPVAIASSAPLSVIDAAVDALRIREHFSHIYSAEFEPYGKPHPGVFLAVAEHFEVRPEECLVFEDSPSGVLAAKAARMQCIAVPHANARDHSFVQTADITLNSLKEFDAEVLTSLG